MATGYSVQHRGGTKFLLDGDSTIVPAKEIYIETDTNKLKFGNGSMSYAALSYLNLLTEDFAGTNFVYVRGSGTPNENGTEFKAKYAQAKTMSPSSTNRITVIVAPGTYNIGSSSVNRLDTAYIDIVSLTGNPDAVFDYFGVNVNNVYVRGIKCTTNFNIYVASNLPNTTFENCVGGNYFAYNGNISSTFINCVGLDGCFGYQGTASGTFINCTANSHGFGGSGSIASGTFIDCTAGNNSFGGGSEGTASGTFIRCSSGERSFGNRTASGTFTDCVGGY